MQPNSGRIFLAHLAYLNLFEQNELTSSFDIHSTFKMVK
jgi:hypothetical protein